MEQYLVFANLKLMNIVFNDYFFFEIIQINSHPPTVND